METGFDVLQYIKNPYTLIAFVVLVIILAVIKIGSANKLQQKTNNDGTKGVNQINVSGSENRLSNIQQSIDENIEEQDNSEGE